MLVNTKKPLTTKLGRLLLGKKEDTPQNYLAVLDKLSNGEIAASEIDLKDIFDE